MPLINSEQAEKELACPLCDRRFKRPCELGRHLQFCKSSRSSATVEPSDDCSSLPCSPRSDASFWNESQMHCIIDQASQTPESAPTSATSPLHQHSAGGSEALQFGPTLGQDEASRSSVQVNEPIRVPSSGCKGYWTNTNAALEAVIEQSCLGLCSSPPEQALRQLCAVIYNFFSQPVPHIPAEPPDNQLRTAPLFGPFARSPATSVGNGDSAPANQPFRLLRYAMISIRPTSKLNGSPDSTRHSPRLADKQRNTRSFGETHTSMVKKYLTQRVQPRRRFLWNKLKCFSQTSLPMKIGVIAMQGTKTFQTHLRKRSHCHRYRYHQHSLNFKRHCTQGATGQRQAQMAFQTQYGSVAHASMLRSLTSYSEFGSHARCLRPGSAR